MDDIILLYVYILVCPNPKSILGRHSYYYKIVSFDTAQLWHQEKIIQCYEESPTQNPTQKTKEHTCIPHSPD